MEGDARCGECPLLRVDSCLPQIHMLKSEPLEYQNATLFGHT